MNKKLQVFVSSTYTDLIIERQAAVQAILTAGHIPAGMELFAAGNESQMEAVKRWIEESDVYLLILGGRYGSIDKHSGKSYTEIEYDYAVSINKPFFTCVVKEEAQEERIKQHGSRVIEQENPALLISFRQKVTSKICRFWTETKDIQLSILETLSNFARREELVGWVRGDEPANTATLAEEVARLAKANTELRQQLSFLTNTDKSKSDLEYALALNWDEKTRFRGFDLSKRDLSNLSFRNADFINVTLCDAILENVDLSGADLTRANLEGTILKGAKYNSRTRWPDGFDHRYSGAIGPYANLQGADLQGANLQGADLQGADLQGANLQRTNLQRTNLQGTNLQRANLLETNLQAANLQEANLQRTNLQRADLQGTDLQRAALQRAALQGTILWRANLQGANLQAANLQEANLQEAKYDDRTRWPDGFDHRYSGAIGPYANLQGADFQGADLQGADLQRADLQRADLRRANLQGANLQGTNLRRANLREANLQEANLQEAALQEANLQGANLQGTNLQGIKLQEADLQGADLQGADLQRADLWGTNLLGANLRRANLQETNLQRTNLQETKYDGRTRWPDGFDPKSL